MKGTLFTKFMKIHVGLHGSRLLRFETNDPATGVFHVLPLCSFCSFCSSFPTFTCSSSSVEQVCCVHTNALNEKVWILMPSVPNWLHTHPWHGISGVRSWRATPKRARSFYCSPPCSNKSFPMDPGSPKLRMVMEPKYYAFRRWLETPIISWEYNWIPRDREWNWKSYLAMVVVWSVKTSWYHSPRSSHHTVESKHFNLNPCFQMKKLAGCFGLHWDISTDLLVLYPSYHGMNITTKSPFRSI